MNRDFKGVWIPKEVWLNKELSLTEKALLIEIDSLDNEFHCVATNSYFAEFLGCSIPTVTRAIAHLKDLGYIEEIEFDGTTRKLAIIKMIRDSNQNDYTPNQNDEHSNTSNNIYIKKEDIFLSYDKNISKKNPEETSKIQDFVDTYHGICKSLPKCVKITEKRKKAISKILKSYSVEDIMTVFHNLEESDFCKGKNDRGWKADIDFLLREDKFVAILEGKYGGKQRNNAERMSATSTYHVTNSEREVISVGAQF